MSFFSSLIRAVAGYAEHQSNEYCSGYERGSQSASNMSDDELRASLKRVKDNGVSGMRGAGKTKAMVDEYKKRNEK